MKTRNSAICFSLLAATQVISATVVHAQSASSNEPRKSIFDVVSGNKSNETARSASWNKNETNLSLGNQRMDFLPAQISGSQSTFQKPQTGNYPASSARMDFIPPQMNNAQTLPQNSNHRASSSPDNSTKVDFIPPQLNKAPSTNTLAAADRWGLSANFPLPKSGDDTDMFAFPADAPIRVYPRAVGSLSDCTYNGYSVNQFFKDHQAGSPGRSRVRGSRTMHQL